MATVKETIQKVIALHEIAVNDISQDDLDRAIKVLVKQTMANPGNVRAYVALKILIAFQQLHRVKPDSVWQIWY